MSNPWWTPKNAVQRAMLAALKRGDTTRYLRLVASAELYLPVIVIDDGETEHRGPVEQVMSGLTLVMVFSAPETMMVAAGHLADCYTTTTYRQLRARWRERQWRPVVDSGSPIATFPTVAALDRAHRWWRRHAAHADDGGLPIFDPVMERLIPVVETGMDAQIEALLDATVTVPTRFQVDLSTDIVESSPLHLTGLPEQPTVEAFTADETIAAAHPDLPNMRLPFPLLLSLLPERVGLVVDPGGPAELALRGDRLLLTIMAASDRLPARQLTTTPRPPHWLVTESDPISLLSQVRGSPPPGRSER